MTEGELVLPIRVTVTPERGPLVRLLTVLALWRVWWFLLLIGVFPWLAVGYLSLYYSRDQAQMLSGMFWYCGTGTLMAFVILPFLTWRSARAQWNANPAAREVREYEFDEARIVCNAPSSRGDFTWELVKKGAVVSGMIVLWVGTNLAHYIPLADVPSERRKALDELLRRKVPGFKGLPT